MRKNHANNLGLWGGLFLIHGLRATSAIAREREQHTLDFLLVLPVERHEILFAKWIGIWACHRLMLCLALAYPLVGMMTGVLSVTQSLVLLVSPVPSLLLVSLLGLLLSVVCRRVITANLALVGILLLILVLHLLRWEEFSLMAEGQLRLMFGNCPEGPFDPQERDRIFWLIAFEQGMLLVLAVMCGALALWRFSRKTSEAPAQVW